MAENEEQTVETLEVSELSDTEVAINYCLQNKIPETRIDELLKRGFMSLKAQINFLASPSTNVIPDKPSAFKYGMGCQFKKYNQF